MFVPTEIECPNPFKYLDVTRQAETDLDSMAEGSMEDLWTEAGSRELSNPWVGKTVFGLIRIRPEPGC